MTDDGLLRIVAAGAAASGVLAVASGHRWAAVVAGACAVGAAVLTLRSVSADEAPMPVQETVDLRGEPMDVVEEPVPPPAQPVPALGRPTLMDEGYLEASLRSRLAVARRALRPLSVVHVYIVGADDRGPMPAELIADAAEATLRESDIVGRRNDGIYVFVLEDTAEDGAVWTTERLRRHIAGTVGTRRFHAGVASYPNHGLDFDTVEANAAGALAAAQDWDRDRIEVAAGR